MYQYKCIMIKGNREDTEKMLNEYAKEGWKVICSYARLNGWIILEKEK